MNASVKTLKCGKCPVRCDNVVDKIDAAISVCKNRSPVDPAGCGLYQLAQAISRRKLPVLLTRRPEPDDEPEYCSSAAECKKNWPCKACRQYDVKKEDRVQDVVKVEVKDDHFEVTVPDPIIVFVHKNGHVEHRGG